MPHPPEHPVPRVHAITSDEILSDTRFLVRARAIMRVLGDRGAVHLRSREIPGGALLRLAEMLVKYQEETGCWLVVNDRVDIALASGARAIQMTSRSMRAADIRAIAPALPIGASVHGVEGGRAAESDGVSWMVAGHVYETASHAGVEARGEELISRLAWEFRTPIVAIGGIVPERIPALRRAGAYGVAAIRGLWSPDNSAGAASDYLSVYDADGD